MKEKIRFTKMHGCGNDYIYINMMEYEIADQCLKPTSPCVSSMPTARKR